MNYKIKVENTTFYYDINFEYGAIGKDILMISNDALLFLKKEILKSVCRPIITEDFIRGKFMVDYLFWLDNLSLNKIDESVIRSTYTDNDFHYAIKTEFIKNLTCFSCNHVFTGGLSVDPIQIYPDNFPLGKKKLSMVKNSDKLLKCSLCGGSFRSMILHVFE